MKVAIIGTWHVHTEEYTRAILENPKAEAVAVWDSDAARGKAFADKMGLPFTADLDSILNDADIDSIVLCSATCDHPALLQKAAAAKKNIFTEKVLTIGVEDAEKAAEAVRASGKVFTISYPHRTFPTLRAAKAMLDSGKLGRVTYARVRNVHNGSSADWLPPHFYDKAQCGGGAMIDLGAHPDVHALLAARRTEDDHLHVYGGLNRGVEDNAVSVIEFENGAIGVSETGFVSECNPYTLEISGTDGSLMIHGESARWGGKATGGKWVDLGCPGGAADRPVGRRGNGGRPRAVYGRRGRHAHPPDGRRVQVALKAAQNSHSDLSHLEGYHWTRETRPEARQAEKNPLRNPS